MEEPKKLQDMPFDILHRIFKMLKFGDQMQLACLHPRFCDVVAEHYRHKFTSFVFNQCELYVNLLILVKLCGSTMIHITFDNTADVEYLLPAVERYCINLETISFTTSEYNCKAIKLFLERNATLKSVELVMNCSNHRSGIHEAISMLESIPNIKRLQLHNFPGHSLIKNKIKGFVHLEELTVGDYFPYDSVPKWRFDISDLLLRLKNLRRLTVINRIVFLNRKLQEPLLEELTLIQCDLNFKKPYFPKLLSFHIERSMYPTKERLLGFILKHATTLKRLHVMTGYMNYAGDGIFRMRVHLSSEFGYTRVHRTIQCKQLRGLQRSMITEM
ncbi:uncharacterized protein LOC111064884 isoform X3 [Drosophila obscura]|uniref:uncharacterized protein LOC111064884 isoform X3 n=1 Tax=Drosophila obscura TaxID=7282 RepID=UPI000B9FBA39|nr:uncharacterized protein LOC111064884 isoform X3 [Drosophila obscura]XP_022208414.1 uncharacterized protein LOC111064884 isoform X3 [Drosophila obscura]